ncbi:MAG TPA: NAD-dependent epimerase/dehydratase family protein [Blastocatellia bacterium]|jgi:UDP-glucuronate 4-epimerase|nr:NAD-dependent epimerase/dehydratase family protein [Blastocatellia bacterium]
MKNILVTGGAGFIGSHLVDRLLDEESARVTVVDNFNDFYDPAIKRANIARHVGREEFELVEADLSDARAVGELLSRRSFECVVHLAARAGVRPSLDDPLAYEESNVRGTYSLLEAARLAGVPQFVFGSSSSVYGVNSKVPFAEDDPISRPISPYAATKIAGEAACHVYSHLYGMRIVCLRFFTVYGARQRPDLAIYKFARLMSEGKPIPLFGDGTSRRDYTYIDDIISGLVAAMHYEGSPFEIINLGESNTVELRRLVELLEHALDKRARIDHHPAQPGDVPLTFADVSKAKRLLGYKPSTPIEEGIGKFSEWFKTRK